MILENVFFTEIQLENGDLDEFVDKGWYALNIDKAYPNEEIGNNAFLDWARDLFWIKENHIIILVKGAINDKTREIIEFLNEDWEEKLQHSKRSKDRKKVDFIIVS